jgi:hypothetical protein
MSHDSETAEIGRAMTAHRTAEANRQEPIYEAKLARLVVAGACDAIPIGDYGWRITAGRRVVDYWPRTGIWRTADGTKQSHGWPRLLRYLNLGVDR